MKFFFGICLCLFFAIEVDATETGGEFSRFSTLKKTDTVSAKLQLQVFQVPLSDVLAEITLKTGVSVHYSVLPQGLVSATCAGSTVEILLKCLLGKSLNLVFRYSEDKGVEGQSGLLKEVWVLGSSLDQSPEMTLCNPKNTEAKVSLAVAEPNKTKQLDVTLVESLFSRIKVGTPLQRADAISALATGMSIENSDVRNVLLKALDDESAIVRVQALFGWAYREGGDALPELLRALQDVDVNVRMKAVDLSQNLNLLMQAAVDPDKRVRQFALMKLEAIEQYGVVE